jgi:hypothetical protein
MSTSQTQANDAPDSREGPENAAGERLFRVLQQVAQAGGAISPSADPHAEHGYSYAAIGDDAARDLDRLARRNYLEQRFFDRVSLCPACGAHHLNVREICPSCRRAHLTTEGLLHHFRCGYVGIPAEFTPTKDDGYVCPKCNGRMHHLGTQYDRLGKAFRCRSCAVISENPPVEAVCLACGTRSPGENLVSTEVYSYAVTSRGAAAIRRTSLIDDDDDDIAAGPNIQVHSRTVTLQFIEYFKNCLEEFAASFSILLVDCRIVQAGQPEADALMPWLTRLRGSVREVDLVGQLADARFIVLLPQTRRRAAEVLADKVRTALGATSPFNFTAIEITAVPQLTQIVAGRNILAKSA